MYLDIIVVPLLVANGKRNGSSGNNETIITSALVDTWDDIEDLSEYQSSSLSSQ